MSYVGVVLQLNGGTAESMVTSPVMINAYVKAFPWLEYTLNASGAIAGFFLPLLFIFAFISTTVRRRTACVFCLDATVD